MKLLALLLTTILIGGSLGALFGWSMSRLMRLAVLLCACLPLTASALTGRVVEYRDANPASVTGYGSVGVSYGDANSAQYPTRWRIRTSSGWTTWLPVGSAKRTMPAGIYRVEFERGLAAPLRPVTVRVESKSLTWFRLFYKP